jgi:hypothetical protein
MHFFTVVFSAVREKVRPNLSQIPLEPWQFDRVCILILEGGLEEADHYRSINQSQQTPLTSFRKE